MEIENWQYKDLVKFIKKDKTSDDQIYEFKRDLISCKAKKIRKHFCAFANKNDINKCGYIFFGIENNHDIIGVIEDKEIGTKISDIVDVPNLNPNVKWSLITPPIPIPKTNPKKFVYIVRIEESIRRNKPHISDNVIYMRKYGKSAPISMLQDLKDYFFSNKFYFEDIEILEKMLVDISRENLIIDKINYIYFIELRLYMLNELDELLKIGRKVDLIEQVITEYENVLNTINIISSMINRNHITVTSMSLTTSEEIRKMYIDLYTLVDDFIKNFKEVFGEQIR